MLVELPVGFYAEVTGQIRIKKGYLSVQVDIYCSMGGKLFPFYYVDKPILPEGGYQGQVSEDGTPDDVADYKNWIKSLPFKTELNPLQCHFIKINPDTTQTELVAGIKGIFTAEVLTQLEDLDFSEWELDAKIKVNSELASLRVERMEQFRKKDRLMNSSEKLGNGNRLPSNYDRAKLEIDIKERFSGSD